MLPKLERELIINFEKYYDAISSTEKRKEITWIVE